MSPGVGVMASGKRVTGGGGATVDIIEVVTPTDTTGITEVIPIATSVTANDRIVVVVLKDTSLNDATISGLGATWVTDTSITSPTDNYIFSGTGGSGSGSITVNGLVSAPRFLVAYVLRGSTGNPVVHSSSNITTGSTSAGVSLSTTSATAPDGSLAIGFGLSNNASGVVTCPDSNALPASGWTANKSIGRLKVISRPIVSSTTVTVSMNTDIFATKFVGRAIYSTS